VIRLNEEENFSIVVKGGIGKHICATTLIRYIKENYPKSKINVLSAFPEVFHYNQKIYRNLHLATPYLFEDYVKGTKFIDADPYQQRDFYENRSHLSEVYPLAYGFPSKNKNIQPELFMSASELKTAKGFVENNKPLITLQTTGGNQAKNQMRDPTDLTGRDLPQSVAEKIVEICKAEGYKILHIKLPQEYSLKDTIELNNLPFRRYIALIPFIRGHIGIDSAMMHAVAAFKKPGLIFWGSTDSNILGYPYMTNKHREACDTPMCTRPRFSMPDFKSEGKWVCPHNYACQQWTDEEITEATKTFLNSIKETNQLKIPLNKEHKNINTKNKKE
jgi:ADP-heptose:LPS heptosyltransferase